MLVCYVSKVHMCMCLHVCVLCDKYRRVNLSSKFFVQANVYSRNMKTLSSTTSLCCQLWEFARVKLLPTFLDTSEQREPVGPCNSVLPKLLCIMKQNSKVCYSKQLIHQFWKFNLSTNHHCPKDISIFVLRMTDAMISIKQPLPH